MEQLEDKKYLKELENCHLCEWQCGVDRLAGEKGCCRMTIPLVSSCQLHPAPPQSYTHFYPGCNFKCLNCQNYTIAHHVSSSIAYNDIRGWIEPEDLAFESLTALKTSFASWINADRIFFSGGEPTIHLPYIEEVVRICQLIEPTKFNYDTNGFLTKDSLKRVLRFATSITYDIKAFNDEVHRALTGAPVEPVLRNAEYIAKYAKDQLWEFRILVIPKIVDEEEIRGICEFIAEMSPSLSVCFLAFRPNFVLDSHRGAPPKLMEKAVKIATDCGLEKAYWSGHPSIKGGIGAVSEGGKYSRRYNSESAQIACAYAFKIGGCRTHTRNCGGCSQQQKCPVQNYKPLRYT